MIQVMSECAMNATYSPEDNKLRLYPTERLPEELYRRVRGAGFIWAPMQKIFVAPMWTPEREDLLLELCGEIGDEETTLEERSQERAERFTEYKQHRAEDAEQAQKAVSAIADNIPLGQPILVGHHSERAARKDAERIENGMRKAVKMWETSKYWEERAKGALRNAAYKKDVFATARRIKTVEANKRREERELSEVTLNLKVWTNASITLEQAKHNANYYHPGDVTLKDGRENWTAWSALEDKLLTVEEVRAQVIPQLENRKTRAERWIRHYENRLTYEKILYGDSGGIASDRVKPEVGGAVRCWVANGTWLYIQKVNKVSVTILDSYRDDEPENTFRRTVPFDNLTKLMSKAEVEEKRASGQLSEKANKTGFYYRTVKDIQPQVQTHNEPEQERQIEDMREQLREGVKVVVAPELFPTPSDLAARMVTRAQIESNQRILEPSAGTGNILTAIVESNPYTKITAIEINQGLTQILRNNFGSVLVTCMDFLEYQDKEGFDRILMNPPFTKGEDIKHIQHALELLKPGGRLVAICANGSRQSEKLKPLSDYWEELPEDTFKSQGTGVRAVLVTFQKRGNAGTLGDYC